MFTKETWKLDISIILLLLIHICLLATILIYQKKIKILEKTNKKRTVQNDQSKQKQQAILKNVSIPKYNETKATTKVTRLYHAPKQYRKAETEYKSLLQQKKDDPDLHLTLGRLYMGNKEKYAQAIMHLQKVLTLEPKHKQRKMIRTWVKALKKQTK